MSDLETELIAAVEKNTATTQTFYDIVHGDAATTVTTDNGEVPTVAKTIADIEIKITTQIGDTATAVTAAQAAQGKAEVAQAKAEAAQGNVEKIVGGSVTTEMIADGSITTVKLASDPVGLALVFGG